MPRRAPNVRRHGRTACRLLVKHQCVFQARPLRVFEIAHGLGLDVTQGKQLASARYDQPSLILINAFATSAELVVDLEGVNILPGTDANILQWLVA